MACVIHLCKFAQLEGIVTLVANSSMDPLPHVSNNVFEPFSGPQRGDVIGSELLVITAI